MKEQNKINLNYLLIFIGLLSTFTVYKLYTSSVHYQLNKLEPVITFQTYNYITKRIGLAITFVGSVFTLTKLITYLRTLSAKPNTVDITPVKEIPSTTSIFQTIKNLFDYYIGQNVIIWVSVVCLLTIISCIACCYKKPTSTLKFTNSDKDIADIEATVKDLNPDNIKGFVKNKWNYIIPDNQYQGIYDGVTNLRVSKLINPTDQYKFLISQNYNAIEHEFNDGQNFLSLDKISVNKYFNDKHYYNLTNADYNDIHGKLQKSRLDRMSNITDNSKLNNSVFAINQETISFIDNNIGVPRKDDVTKLVQQKWKHNLTHEEYIEIFNQVTLLRDKQKINNNFNNNNQNIATSVNPFTFILEDIQKIYDSIPDLQPVTIYNHINNTYHYILNEQEYKELSDGLHKLNMLKVQDKKPLLIKGVTSPHLNIFEDPLNDNTNNTNLKLPNKSIDLVYPQILQNLPTIYDQLANLEKNTIINCIKDNYHYILSEEQYNEVFTELQKCKQMDFQSDHSDDIFA